MNKFLSIIICTHNPQENYLEQVLTALKHQSLPLEKWELLLIDNASNQKLSSKIDLNWHPQARHFREEKLGLTPARLCGIRNAQAESLVFIDDDNVLDRDFLEITLEISHKYPFIGAWGGQIKPKFEKQPPDWMKPHLSILAIREFDRDKWSNLLYQHETTPCGAGLCVRKNVAQQYVQLVENDPRRIQMGRKGKSLTACEDTDIAFTACDMGLGTGQFAALKLTHLISANRVEEDYFFRLVEGMNYSKTILEYLWGKSTFPEPWRLSKIYLQYLSWRYGKNVSRLCKASQKGIQSALEEIATWQID